MIDPMNVHELTDPENEAVKTALLLYENELKKVRKKIVNLEAGTDEVDAKLDLLQGKGEAAGLLARFGHVPDGSDSKKKKKAPKDDPRQTTLDHEASHREGDDANVPVEDAEEPRDYRTHDLHKDGVEELVTAICADNEPPAAVRILNALEAGEQERAPKPRANVLGVIRNARATMAKKVKRLALAE